MPQLKNPNAPPHTERPSGEPTPAFSELVEELPSPRKKRWWLWIGLAAGMALLIAAAAIGWWLFSDEPEAPAESEEPTEFCIEDADLGKIWLPIHSPVPRQQYDTNGFTEQDGWLRYQSGNVKSLVCIDLSEFQGEVDFEAVKAAGVEAVIVRVGWRGYYTGNLSEDVSFRENMEGALNAGLAVGVYFFSQATSEAEAAEEAAFVLECIKPYSLSLPVFFDFEEVQEADARTAGMTNGEITEAATTFCRAIEAAGYDAGVYFYKALAYYRYDLSKLTDYAFWLSEPGDRPTFYYDFSVWQYDVAGKIDGVEGTVDLNVCFTADGDRPTDTATAEDNP